MPSVKTEWAWNQSHQHLYEKAKSLSKKDVCMRFYVAAETLYLERDASRIGLGVRLP